jgi:hypothetical protein
MRKSNITFSEKVTFATLEEISGTMVHARSDDPIICSRLMI